MSDKKVAIITAGGSGMGADSARKLAQDGFNVAILSSSGKGEALAKELGGIGVTGSNQSNDDLKSFVDQTVEKWGRIDVLVNSAGHGPRAPILELTDEEWHTGMDVYFMNVVRPTRLVTPVMLEQKVRRHHQHFDLRGVRTRSGIPNIRRIPRRTCRIYEAVCRQLRCRQHSHEQCTARFYRQPALK